MKVRKVWFFNRLMPPNQEQSAVMSISLIKMLAKNFNVHAVCSVSSKGGDNNEKYNFNITRTINFFSGKKGILSKLIQYPLSLISMIAVGLRCKKEDYCLIWSDPPLLDIFLSILLKFKNVPYGITVQDWFLLGLVSEGVVKKNNIFYKLLLKLNIYAYKNADKIICISQDTCEVLKEYGVYNTTIIENWCSSPENFYYKKDARSKKWENTEYKDKTIIKYAGNIGFACDLEGFADSLKYLKNIDDFLFVFQAKGRKIDFLNKLTKKYKQVKIENRVPWDKVGESMNECDAHLILTPNRLFGIVYASKLYSILASGKALIASVPERSEMHDFINNGGIGFSANANDPEGLAKAFESINEVRKNNLLGKYEESSLKLSSHSDITKATKKYEKLINDYHK